MADRGDGSVTIIVDADAKQAQQELERVQKSIQRLEEKIQKISTMRSPLVEQARQLAAELDVAKAKMHEMQAETNGSYSTMQIAKQKENVAALQAEYNRVQSCVEAYDRKLKDANYDLNAAKEKAGKLTAQITYATGATERLEQAASGVTKSMNRFGNRISSLFSGALVFSVVSQGLSKLRTWLGETVKKNDEARAAIAKLKGALLTLAQPILQVVIPVFIKLINIITQVVTAVAKLFGMLSGKSLTEQISAAQSLNEEEKALEGVGSAAEKAQKSMAGFDEINQLASKKESSGGSSAGSASTDIVPDFTGLDLAQDKFETILGIVGAIAAGLLAWKIASLFTDSLSKIGGIALAAAGAFALVYFWLDAWNNGIDMTNLIGMVAGLAALTGGLAIAFGSTAAGIALVVGGLAMLVVGIKDILENGLNLENLLTVVIGAIALIVGFGLALGSTAAGIAAIVAGLSMLVIGIKDVIENGFNLENTLLIIAGLLATGLGIALLTGSWIPLLIAAIAAVLVALVSFTGHGEELISGLKETVKGFGKFFKGIFTGDMKLAAEGAKQIWEGLKKTWNAIVGSIRDAWDMFVDWLKKKNPEFAAFFEDIGKLVSGLYDSFKTYLKGIIDFVVGVFTGDWEKAWEGVKGIFNGAWNAMVTIVETAINLIIDGINWMISKLNSIQINIPEWVPLVGGKSYGINIPTVSRISLPRLASGAVIPPNREFLAVLGDQKSGTNIETPLSTMVQAFRQAMSESGSGRSITVVLEVDKREFARAVYKANNDETQRVGVRLAGVKT